jgi:hypothetical protein
MVWHKATRPDPFSYSLPAMIGRTVVGGKPSSERFAFPAVNHFGYGSIYRTTPSKGPIYSVGSGFGRQPLSTKITSPSPAGKFGTSVRDDSRSLYTVATFTPK